MHFQVLLLLKKCLRADRKKSAADPLQRALQTRTTEEKALKLNNWRGGETWRGNSRYLQPLIPRSGAPACRSMPFWVKSQGQRARAARARASGRSRAGTLLIFPRLLCLPRHRASSKAVALAAAAVQLSFTQLEDFSARFLWIDFLSDPGALTCPARLHHCSHQRPPADSSPPLHLTQLHDNIQKCASPLLSLLRFPCLPPPSSRCLSLIK